MRTDKTSHPKAGGASDRDDRVMKIGELARATGSTRATIRFYEKEGLMPAPARSDSNYRWYGRRHLERLRFVRNCRALAMNHDEIRALLALIDRPRKDCDEIDALLEAHIRHVEVRLSELERLHRQLSALQGRCERRERVEHCGIIEGLFEMAPAAGSLPHPD